MENEWEKEFDALKKLDEAIQALKDVGYTFNSSQFSDRTAFSDLKDYSKRYINIDCEKILPFSETEEVKTIRTLSCFKRG